MRTAGLVAVALAAVVSIGGLTIVRVNTGREEALADRLDGRVVTSGQFLSDYVSGVFAQEKIVATQMLSGPVSAQRFSQFVGDDDYPAAVLLDKAGLLLAVQPPAPELLGTAMGARYAHLAGALAGRPTASGVIPSAAKSQPIVAFAVPFATPSGPRVFSFGYPVASTPMAPFIDNAYSLKGSRVLLVDTAGDVVVSSDPDVPAGSALDRHPQLAAAARMTTGYTMLDGQRSYVSSVPVDGTPWRLVFTVGTGALFAPLLGPGQWFPWVILAGLAIAAGGALRLWWRASTLREASAANEELRTAIVNTAVDAFLGMSETGEITDWNNAAERLFGWSFAEASGRRMTDFLAVPTALTDDGNAPRAFFDQDDWTLTDHELELTGIHRDGHVFPVELAVSKVGWQDGWRFNGFVRDITQRRVYEEQLRQLADTDPLTGLANRRVALDRLGHALTRTRRQGTTVAVLYIDVDRFKVVNDSHGHAVGDAILVGVADRLRATFRTEDTLARLGGDEFAVICEDLSNDRPGDLLLERIIDALGEPYLVGDLHLSVDASVGLATGTDAEQPATLLAQADRAMYAAKAAAQEVIRALRG